VTDDKEGYEQVRLCAVQGEVAARLLQHALAAEGIPSRTQVSSKDSLGISFPAVYAGATTTLIEVWVNKRDLERAEAVLEAYEGEGDEEGEGER
jgi:hypothetical protein